MIPPSDRVRIGECEVIRLLDGTFRVDGGAMFGVVPRTLWASQAVPDAENRITLALNCYLVRTPAATVLLDTGVGPDVGRRRTDFYSFERRPGLVEGLAELGLGPDGVDIVVNSHLHFDHCGGNEDFPKKLSKESVALNLNEIVQWRGVRDDDHP